MARILTLTIKGSRLINRGNIDPENKFEDERREVELVLDIGGGTIDDSIREYNEADAMVSRILNSWEAKTQKRWRNIRDGIAPKIGDPREDEDTGKKWVR